MLGGVLDWFCPGTASAVITNDSLVIRFSFFCGNFRVCPEKNWINFSFAYKFLSWKAWLIVFLVQSFHQECQGK